MALVRGQIKPPKLGLCTVQFFKKPRPGHIHQMILNEPRHQLRPVLMQHYQELDTNRLRHLVEVDMLKAKKVARVQCKRRLMAALGDALQEQGIDPHGKRMDDGRQVLKGQVYLRATPSGLRASREDTVPEMRKVVHYVFNMCGYNETPPRMTDSRSRHA